MSWFTPKKLGIILAVSLTLNVFLIGIIIGARVIHGNFGHGSMMPRDIAGPVVSPRGMYRLMKRLPDEKQDAARAIIDTGRDEMRSRMEGMRDAREEVRDILRQPDLDRAALDEALKDVRDQGLEMQVMFHKGLGDMAELLDAEYRERLAKPRGWR